MRRGAPRIAMRAFTYTASSARVVFGPDAVQRLPDELEKLPATRALVVCTPGQQALGESIAARLGSRACGVLAIARMHVPVATAKAARDAVAVHDADALVPVGGGSTIGLAKAVALTTGLPILAVPTTYPARR